MVPTSAQSLALQLRRFPYAPTSPLAPPERARLLWALCPSPTPRHWFTAGISDFDGRRPLATSTDGFTALALAADCATRHQVSAGVLAVDTDSAPLPIAAVDDEQAAQQSGVSRHAMDHAVAASRRRAAAAPPDAHCRLLWPTGAHADTRRPLLDAAALARLPPIVDGENGRLTRENRAQYGASAALAWLAPMARDGDDAAPPLTLRAWQHVIATPTDADPFPAWTAAVAAALAQAEVSWAEVDAVAVREWAAYWPLWLGRDWLTRFAIADAAAFWAKWHPHGSDNAFPVGLVSGDLALLSRTASGLSPGQQALVVSGDWGQGMDGQRATALVIARGA